MEVPDCTLGYNGLFVFADCAVNVDFDSQKLAEIAAVSAESFRSANLSSSWTGSSGTMTGRR